MSFKSDLRRILRLVLLVDLTAAALVGALGLLLRWSTRAAWGEAFVWSGLLAIAIGGLAVRGSWDSRLAHVGFAASAGQPGMEERTKHMTGETMGAYRRLLFLLVVAAPLVALGLWIDPRA